MRGLTVRDPWAWAIAHAGKRCENRTRSLGPYRGTVAIHTSMTLDQAALSDPRIAAAVTDTDSIVSRPGHVIALAELVDVHRWDVGPACCAPWGEHDAVHHVLSDVRVLADPLPYVGALGLWKPSTALEHVLRQTATTPAVRRG